MPAGCRKNRILCKKQTQEKEVVMDRLHFGSENNNGNFEIKAFRSALEIVNKKGRELRMKNYELRIMNGGCLPYHQPLNKRSNSFPRCFENR